MARRGKGTQPASAPRSRWLLGSFSGFQRGWVRGDVLAGLTVWAVLVPESLAYATIAGVPPVVGLYAAVPALVLYALLGSSRHLVVSPMSATAALSAGIVGTLSTDPTTVVALTTGLAIATGIAALAAGLLRLGFLASLISEPVLKGFIIGLALTILVGQLPKLIGVDKGAGNFFEQAWAFLRHLGDLQPLSLAVGLSSLVLLLLLRRWLPVLPGSLVVSALAVLAVVVFHLDQHGLDVVGDIRPGLPALGWPGVSGHQLLDLLGPALGVMLVGFGEGLAAAKTYAARAGYDVDPNRELLGLGAANLGSGLSSGMVVNGSLSKTAVNGSAGARSQLSGLTAAALALVTLLFLTGLFERLPEPTLAAIVVTAVVELIDVASLRRLWRVQTGRLSSIYRYTSRADFLAAVAALAGVLAFDTLPGLMIGVGVSLVLLLARTSRPHVAVLAPLPATSAATSGVWVDVERHPGLTPPERTLVLRVEGPLFFGNADFVRERVHALVGAAAAGAERGPAVVVLDGQTTPSIDVTAATMLVQLRAELERDGTELVLAGGVGQVRDVLERSEPAAEPPVVATVADALQRYADPPAGADTPADPRVASPASGEGPEVAADHRQDRSRDA